MSMVEHVKGEMKRTRQNQCLRVSRERGSVRQEEGYQESEALEVKGEESLKIKCQEALLVKAEIEQNTKSWQLGSG